MLVIDAGAPKRGLPPGNKFGCCWKPDVEGLLTEISIRAGSFLFPGLAGPGFGDSLLDVGELD